MNRNADDFTPRDRSILAGFVLTFWMLVPLPFWVLASGFGGGLFVPDFGISGDGDFTVVFVFSALFYAPLAIVALLIQGAIREHRSGHAGTNASDQNGMPENGRKQASIWDNDAGVPKLVPAAEPPQRVEIGGAPISDQSHEFVVRKPKSDAQDR